MHKQARPRARTAARRRSRATCALRGALALALLAPAHAAAQSPYDAYLAPPSACPGSEVLTVLAANQELQMLCLVDYARATGGLPALTRTPMLAWSAAIKADDIVRCGDFSHTACGRDTNAPFEQAGYIAPAAQSEVTENLATGSGLFANPRSIMLDWLRDEPHRTAILDPRWRDQGVAMRRPPGLGDGAVWVSHFGYRSVGGGGALAKLKLTAGPARPRAGRSVRYSFLVTGVTDGVRAPVAGATVKFASGAHAPTRAGARRSSRASGARVR